jgi:pantoate--beta-alanine ligase
LIGVEGIAEVRHILADVRGRGARIGFVPTMGYLHEGHLSLCDVARQHADFLVLSAFVNPLQFGAGEDLDRYPRDMERDRALAAERAVDLMFAPAAAEMYPDGGAAVVVTAPALADRLCGRFRPGHFDGVLTVVAKLFNIVSPDVAVFGRKDLQQAALIRAMVRDLDFSVNVVLGPIVREADGLALSSRNIYLGAAERSAALSLGRSLQAAQDAFAAGETDPARVTAAARQLLDRESGVRVQYVEVVDADTLDAPASAAPGHAVAVAAHVGATRLIDNHLLT